MSTISRSERLCTKCRTLITDGRKGSYCNPCNAAYRRARRTQGYYKETPQELRERNYLAHYGISFADYTRLYEEQQGRCAICGDSYPLTTETPKRGAPRDQLVVDHCHKTGKVRGLLCHSCNVLLGKMDDSVQGVQAMMRFLSGEERKAS